jgi:hypothetical protein
VEPTSSAVVEGSAFDALLGVEADDFEEETPMLDLL